MELGPAALLKHLSAACFCTRLCIFESIRTMNRRDAGAGFNHKDTMYMLTMWSHGAVDAESQDQT